MDLQSRGLFYFFSVQAWAAWRLDFVSLIILGMSAFMVPAMHGKVEAGLTGLSLVYANSIVGIFQACTRMGAEILARFTSIERITEYISEVPAEVGPKEIAQEVPPPATWPSNGAIDFEDVTVSYRDGLPPVFAEPFSCNQSRGKGWYCGQNWFWKIVINALPVQAFREIDDRSNQD